MNYSLPLSSLTEMGSPYGKGTEKMNTIPNKSKIFPFSIR